MSLVNKHTNGSSWLSFGKSSVEQEVYVHYLDSHVQTSEFSSIPHMCVKHHEHISCNYSQERQHHVRSLVLPLDSDTG